MTDERWDAWRRLYADTWVVPGEVCIYLPRIVRTQQLWAPFTGWQRSELGILGEKEPCVEVVPSQSHSCCWMSQGCLGRIFSVGFEFLVPCSNCLGVEQQRQGQNFPQHRRGVPASSAQAEQSWLSCQQSCPLQEVVQKGERMGSPGNTALSRLPRRGFEGSSCKSFCLCLFKHGSLRGFFERGFLVCFFQVAGDVCLSCRWPAPRLSSVFAGAGNSKLPEQRGNIREI